MTTLARLTLFIIMTALSYDAYTQVVGKGENSGLSPLSIPSKVDFGQMEDTTLIILGSFSLHNWQFQRAEDEGGAHFAKVELTIKNRQLKSWEMLDTNTGCLLKMTFNNDGEWKHHKIRCKDEWARNAPSFFWGRNIDQ